MKTDLTAAELITALRICANQTCCDNCPRYDIDHDQDAQNCCIQLINDAADIIEAQQKLIAELEDELKNLENAYIAELTQAHINVQRSAKIYREWYEAVGSKRGKDNERA